jgi:hypothetical protein
MRPSVARLFRAARRHVSGGELNAAAGTDWTDAEVRATVGDYLVMLTDEIAGRPYQKAAHRRDLRQQLSPSRTEAAIEFKHQNISAALADLGLPYIKGYRPRGNYQSALLEEIRRRLEAQPGLLGSMRLTETSTRSGLALREEPQPRRRPYGRRGTHVDYGLLQEENRRLGQIGEKLVVEYERRRLKAAGRADLADQVRWVSREDGDGLGYDVLSFDSIGGQRHIEVKSTSLDSDAPFYLTSAELAFAHSNLYSYALYRVYGITNEPRFFRLAGAAVIGLEMVPVTYRAWPPL